MKNKLYGFEKKLYEALGVRCFRILVFKLEKFIHYRDKGTNINYHISKYEPSALEDFVKYLFYNGAIHVRNVAYFAVYVVLRLVLGTGIRWYDIVLFLFAVKDIYCVMLQRYNYIRIYERKCRLEQRIKAQLQRRFDTMQGVFVECYDRRYIAEDLATIRSMKQRIQAGEMIVIQDAERKTLQRILSSVQKSKED